MVLVHLKRNGCFCKCSWYILRADMHTTKSTLRDQKYIHMHQKLFWTAKQTSQKILPKNVLRKLPWMYKRVKTLRYINERLSCLRKDSQILLVLFGNKVKVFRVLKEKEIFPTTLHISNRWSIATSTSQYFCYTTILNTDKLTSRTSPREDTELFFAKLCYSMLSYEIYALFLTRPQMAVINLVTVVTEMWHSTSFVDLLKSSIRIFPLTARFLRFR